MTNKNKKKNVLERKKSSTDGPGFVFLQITVRIYYKLPTQICEPEGTEEERGDKKKIG